MQEDFLPPAVKAAISSIGGGSIWLRDAMLYLMFLDPSEAEAEAQRLHEAATAWRQAADAHLATVEAWGSVNTSVQLRQALAPLGGFPADKGREPGSSLAAPDPSR